MRRVRRAVPIVALLAALGPGSAVADAATRYVSSSGNDTANNCLVEALPCATIQHGIDEAAATDTVEVAAGSYVEALTIDKELNLRGPNAGIDPNAGSRQPEAIIDGGSGTAIIPEVPKIAIEGFTVSTDDAGFPIYTSGTNVTGLTVTHNILGSGVRALTIATSGEDLSILNNRLAGDIFGIHFGNGTYSNVRINGNHVLGPVANDSIFINGNGTIDEFQLVDNTITDSANIAANISEGLVSGNSFDVPGPGGLSLQISLHGSVLKENSFDGNGTTSCLQIFGSQFGLVPSKDLLVTDNSFDDCNVYGIQLSPDVEEITITGNTITDAKQGINTRDIDPWDVTGKQIEIFANRIVGSTEAGISNTVSGTLDARNNWWGCNGGPGAAGCAPSVGSVETTPHLVLSGEVAPEIAPGASTQVTARLDRNSAGETISGIPDGPTVDFTSALGSFSPPGAALVGGTASSTFTAGSQTGPAGIQVELDGEVLGLPLTIAAPLTQPPPPPAATTPPRPEKPEIEVANDGEEKVVSRGGRFEIATVDCPVEGCAIRTPMHSVKIAGKFFNVRAGTRRWVGAGESAGVRLLFTRAARRAFLAAGRGRASITVVVTTVEDVTEARTVEIEVELENRPDAGDA